MQGKCVLSFGISTAAQFFFFLHPENLFPMFLPQRIWNSTSGSRSWCTRGVYRLLFISHPWQADSLAPDFSGENGWIKSGSGMEGRSQAEYFSDPHGTGARIVRQTLINRLSIFGVVNLCQWKMAKISAWASGQPEPNTLALHARLLIHPRAEEGYF